MGNFKKMIFGEKMPDKDDPQYRERYEKEVNAGMKFARFTRIDRIAVYVQDFANRHTKAFLIMVFGFVLGFFTYNMYRFILISNNSTNPERAIERQEKMLKQKRVTLHEFATSNQKDITNDINIKNYE